jgi:hypothetical protein
VVAAVAEVPAELAEDDHAQEDQPDDEHCRDHGLAFLGSGLRGERQERSERSHGATLPDPRPVILERLYDRLAAEVVPGEARGLAAAHGRRGRRPRLAIAGEAVGPQSGAERDQSSQVGDGLDRPRLGYAHEPVRVEVVPEQERGVGIGGCEQPRLSVVEEIALVDGLQAERVALLAERREDRFELPFSLRQQRGLPEPALVRGLEGDRLPEARRYSQRASSFVQ